MMLRGFCSYCVGFIFSANVRDDLPGTDGARDAAKPSISSDSGGGLGRSLGSDNFCVPSGVTIKRDIRAMVGDADSLTAYCVNLRNQAMGQG